MPHQRITAHMPTGGLNRAYGYQQQPPYTSADLLNVRADSTLDGRERGSSRPGLAKAFTTLLGSGEPVRLLNQIREVFSTSGVEVTDPFDGLNLSSAWAAMPWTGTFISASVNAPTGGLPGTSGSGLVRSTGTIPPAYLAYGEVEAAVHSLIDLDTAQSTTITMVANQGGTDPNYSRGGYWIFARMTDVTPNIQVSGVFLYGVKNAAGTQIVFRIGVVVAGVLVGDYTGTSITTPVTTTFPITLKVLGDFISATCDGQEVLASTDISSLTLPAGRRVGFGVQSLYQGGFTTTYRAAFDDFTVSYVGGSGNLDSLNRTRMLASSAGTLYRENASMQFDSVTDVNSLDLASDRLIESSERLGYLFIADNGIRDMGTDGFLASQADLGTTYDYLRYTAILDDAGAQDWTTKADVGDVVWIYAATTAANIRLARVTSVGASNITLSSDTAWTNEGSSGTPTISYRVLRGLKVYSSVGNTLRTWTTSAGTDPVATAGVKGVVPFGCSLVAKHLDRMYLAGAADAPHLWFASRQGDPYDFDYSASGLDLQRAVASSSNDAGEFGEPITALIPYHDDYLIFGCRSSLWILRGDPAQGGRIDNMSRVTGCLSARSWCYAPGGELYILGSDGLYAYQAGTGGFAESTRRNSLSREKLPEELRNLNPEEYHITMGYDVTDRGVHLFVTPVMSTVGAQHWWIDLENMAFFPVTLPVAMEAMASHYYVADNPAQNAMLLGGRDGYVRKFYPLATTDDGTAFTSYAYLGPFMLGGKDSYEGVLTELDAVLPTDSNSVTWSVHTGTHEQEALGASAAATGTFIAGVSRRARPWRRGRAAYLKITGSAPWSVESITMGRHPSGRQRVS